MGMINYLLSFVRTKRGESAVSDVKGNPQGGANRTAQNFTPPGDDSHPLPGDYFLSVDVDQTGRVAACGYVDPKDTQEAQAGEKRFYSRDSSGEVVATVWLKNDGTITSFNSNGN